MNKHFEISSVKNIEEEDMLLKNIFQQKFNEIIITIAIMFVKKTYCKQKFNEIIIIYEIMLSH